MPVMSFVAVLLGVEAKQRGLNFVDGTYLALAARSRAGHRDSTMLSEIPGNTPKLHPVLMLVYIIFGLFPAVARSIVSTLANPIAHASAATLAQGHAAWPYDRSDSTSMRYVYMVAEHWLANGATGSLMRTTRSWSCSRRVRFVQILAPDWSPGCLFKLQTTQKRWTCRTPSAISGWATKGDDAVPRNSRSTTSGSSEVAS
eukprot:1224518-Amphidinium_carterae.1